MATARIARLSVVVGVLIGLGGAIRVAAAPKSSTLSLAPFAEADSPLVILRRPALAELLVVEKSGRIRSIEGSKAGKVVLDLHNTVSTGNEQGLLGAAFSLDGDTLFVDYTDRKGDTRVVAYPWVVDHADSAKPRELLKVDQPFPNHNGGNLVVDSEDLLWIGMGDGGSGGDPKNNAQNRNSLLGKLLRIDPHPSTEKPYTIPPSNPFALRGGAPEIWALGLRNPWRFSIDAASNTLWIGDVGQSTWEEVDAVPLLARAGPYNFGWRRMEGPKPYNSGKPDASFTAPVHSYRHTDGACSVTGGEVYRGRLLPDLIGTYVFADYCAGRLKGITRSGAGWKVRDLGVQADNVAGFGTDLDGELLVLTLDGPILRLQR